MWGRRFSAWSVLLVAALTVGAGCGQTRWRDLSEEEKSKLPIRDLWCLEIRDEGRPVEGIGNALGLRREMGTDGPDDLKEIAETFRDGVALGCPELFSEPEFRAFLTENGVEVPPAP